MADESPLKLVFAAPKVAKPPRHFADLAPDERVGAVTELGLPAFRATQLSTHYYAGFSADPMTWTDLPAAQREQVRDALFPPLLNYVRDVSCDNGSTVKTLWKLHDGTLVESVLMRYGVRRDGTPGPNGVRSHPLCLVAGRLRHGLPVLRHRPGRSAAQPQHGRDRRPGAGGVRVAGRGRPSRRPRPPRQRRVHGHGRAAGQLLGGHQGCTGDHVAGARGARHLGARASRSRPSAWCRGSRSSRPRASR